MGKNNCTVDGLTVDLGFPDQKKLNVFSGLSCGGGSLAVFLMELGRPSIHYGLPARGVGGLHYVSSSSPLPFSLLYSSGSSSLAYVPTASALSCVVHSACPSLLRIRSPLFVAAVFFLPVPLACLRSHTLVSLFSLSFPPFFLDLDLSPARGVIHTDKIYGYTQQKMGPFGVSAGAAAGGWGTIRW